MTYNIRNPEIENLLHEIAKDIGQKLPENWGMTLMLFEFGEGGNLFYVSTAQRDTMIKAMKEFIREMSTNRKKYNAWNNRRMTAIQQRWRKHGLCIMCGLQTKINPRTNKHYSKCFKHQVAQSIASKKWRDKQ